MEHLSGGGGAVNVYDIFVAGTIVFLAIGLVVLAIMGDR